MKTTTYSLIFFLVCSVNVFADVKLTKLKDRIRVEVNGELFTEWRHNDWSAPYLHPVVGPNGETVTRSYPMKDGVPHEAQDHPHHRSFRFCHSDVNGFNFWYLGSKERTGHTAEIKLEKFERMASGKSGELIVWNQWLGDGKLVLRERVRIKFMPLDKRQMLMDYDIELHAGDKPVTLRDEKDGGLLVRVAGTMKVAEHRSDKAFKGTILNSQGERNRKAWGKRATWLDYFGPDASGKTVGIAMFDHPENLRFPTHWHARTYGLLTPNRFGGDHFALPEDSHFRLICEPHKRANCPACKSRGGDYTIAPGESLSLNHRIYFHHGDSQHAEVARYYAEYTKDKSYVVRQMKSLARQYKGKEIIDRFGGEDFSAWPKSQEKVTAEAFYVRGRNYWIQKQGAAGEADLRAAVRLAPRNGQYWLTLADNAARNLNDPDAALAAYDQAYKLSGGGNNGWLPLAATLGAVNVLVSDLRTDEALELLGRHNNLDAMVTSRRVQVLRALGRVLATQGRGAKAMAKFIEANELERKGSR